MSAMSPSAARVAPAAEARGLWIALPALALLMAWWTICAATAWALRQRDRSLRPSRAAATDYLS
jgi:hypothetical protein